MGFLTRLWLVERFIRISHYIECAHRNYEMIEVATAILRVPRQIPGVIVEAGAYRGGSAAKLSLCAQLVGRKLVVFDSFEGLPENSEVQAIGSQQGVTFKAGWYAGSVEQVRTAIGTFGCLDTCEFVQGWFSHTMPSFTSAIAVAYLDVDLVSSTRDCLISLYPRLAPNGTLFSQDGHLSKIIELFAEDAFWRDDVGVEKPQIRGLRTRKLISTVKTA